MAKKGLIHRLTMGRDDKPDYDVSKLPSNRWAQFKDIFFSRLGALVKINLLVLIFIVPALVVVLLFWLQNQAYSMALPHSANLGIGYYQATNITAMVSGITLFNNLQMYIFLIPAIIVAAVGLAGGFNVIKLLAWGEGISVAAHFFGGIKKHIWQFLCCGVIFAVMFSVIAFNLQYFAIMNDELVPWGMNVTAVRIIGIIVCIISLVVLFSMTMYATTQAATYKLKIPQLIKNSFLLSLALMPQNLLILLLSFLPLLVTILVGMFIPIAATFGIGLFVFIGISYMILVWTIYAHYVFDKFINDRVEGAEKNKGLYIQTEEEKAEREERRRKATNVRFANPKKNKPVKSVDEGSTYTPLATTFSRADLARLAEEKEHVKQEIDQDYEDVDAIEGTKPDSKED